MLKARPIIAIMTFPYPTEFVVCIVRGVQGDPFDKQEKRFYKYSYKSNHIGVVLERAKFLYGELQARFVAKYM